MNVWPLVARGPLPPHLMDVCSPSSVIWYRWPLQGCLAASMAAAGPLQCRYACPPFNGAAAVNCFLLSSSLLFSSCMVSNKNRNNTEIAI